MQIQSVLNSLGVQQNSAVQGSGAQPGSASPSTSFSSYLTGALNQVSQMDSTANTSLELAGAGAGPDVHTIMIQAEEAKLAVDLTVQIRNKALDAYSEIMKMQM